jgi:hypothetical protein
MSVNKFIVKKILEKGDVAASAIKDLKGYVESLRRQKLSDEGIKAYEEACASVEKKIMEELEK